MSDIQVEVPYVCPDEGCTKSFGHELDPEDNEHGEGIYKNVVTLEGVYVKQWAPGTYAMKPYVQIKITSDTATRLLADGWNVRHVDDTDRNVFGEPCWVLYATGRVIHTYAVFGPVDVVLRGFDWTWEERSGRKAYLVDVTDRLVRQED